MGLSLGFLLLGSPPALCLRDHRTPKLSRLSPDVPLLFQRRCRPPDAQGSICDEYLRCLNPKVERGTTDDFHTAQPHQETPHVGRRQPVDAFSPTSTVPAVAHQSHASSNLNESPRNSRRCLGSSNVMLTPPPSPHRHPNPASYPFEGSLRHPGPMTGYPPSFTNSLRPDLP